MLMSCLSWVKKLNIRQWLCALWQKPCGSQYQASTWRKNKSTPQVRTVKTKSEQIQKLEGSALSWSDRLRIQTAINTTDHVMTKICAENCVYTKKLSYNLLATKSNYKSGLPFPSCVRCKSSCTSFEHQICVVSLPWLASIHKMLQLQLYREHQ